MSRKNVHQKIKHVSIAPSMESSVLIRFEQTTKTVEARGRSPGPKAVTTAIQHASDELERTVHPSTPISQDRSLQEEAMSMPQNIVPVELPAREPPPKKVTPESMRRFPVVPGYYLRRFIEDGDPIEDEGGSRSTIAPPVGYKSYGPKTRALRNSGGTTYRMK